MVLNFDASSSAPAASRSKPRERLTYKQRQELKVRAQVARQAARSGNKSAPPQTQRTPHAPRFVSGSNAIPVGTRAAPSSDQRSGAEEGIVQAALRKDAMAARPVSRTDNAAVDSESPQKRSRLQLRTAAAPTLGISAASHGPSSAGGSLTVDPHEPPSKRRRTATAHSPGGPMFPPGATDAVPERVRHVLPHHSLPMTHSGGLLNKKKLRFEDLDVDPKLRSTLSQKFQIDTLTKVQNRAIPVLMSSTEEIGISCFLRAATGSGKTLSYLVPLVNWLSQQPGLDRTAGTMALVLAPTRELCIQICDVATALLRPWIKIVAGTLMGGESKNHEKSRIRKGLNVVVATPGRLVDHIAHTQSLDLSRVRWLVLDEADRLLELGFEKDIHRIMEALEVVNSGRGRRNILVSATLPATVHELASRVLGGAATESVDEADDCRHLVRIGIDEDVESEDEDEVGQKPSTAHGGEDGPPSSRGGDHDKGGDSLEAESGTDSDDGDSDSGVAKGHVAGGGQEHGLVVDFSKDRSSSELEVPRGLNQFSCVVPSKYKLVCLLSFLQQKLAIEREKCIVFFGCCATVDFHHAVLSWLLSPADGQRLPAGAIALSPSSGAVNPAEEDRGRDRDNPVVASRLPQNLTVFRLHGDIPQKQRTATYFAFCAAKGPSLLLCTDVAARGLDFPDVQTVMQYDPPGAPKEYLHRIGRTARAGHEGNAYLLLVSSESPYLDLLQTHGISLSVLDLDDFLLKPLRLWIRRSNTDDCVAALQHWIQVCVQRHALEGLARDAFINFLRSYATHARIARYIFHPRKLHLGHVARAFGLEDAPSKVAVLAETSLGSKLNTTNKKVYDRVAKQKEAEERQRKQAAREGVSYESLVHRIAAQKAKKTIFMSE